MQDVDAGGALGPEPPVLVVPEHGPVHGGEVDDGDGEGPVHVEDDAAQAGARGGHRGERARAGTRGGGRDEEEGSGEEGAHNVGTRRARGIGYL